MKNTIEMHRKARFKRRHDRMQKLKLVKKGHCKACEQKIIERDWSILGDYPIWIYQPASGFVPNLASQAMAEDMNQDTSSYPLSQNRACQSFSETEQVVHANRPETEQGQADSAQQVEQLANELKSVVQQADQKGQKVVAVTLRVEFEA